MSLPTSRREPTGLRATAKKRQSSTPTYYASLGDSRGSFRAGWAPSGVLWRCPAITKGRRANNRQYDLDGRWRLSTSWLTPVFPGLPLNGRQTTLSQTTIGGGKAMLDWATRHARVMARGPTAHQVLAVPLCFWFVSLFSASALRADERSPEIVSFGYAVGRGPEARVVNGLPTTWYPAVGALLHRDSDAFGNWCTATLIGCNTVLTAAHCVAEDAEVSNYRMFLQHGGIVKIKSIDWQKKDYREPTVDGEQADIAVLTLEEPISGIAPEPINLDREHAPNVPGTIVGFGRTGGKATDYGLKRFGPVKAAECGEGFTKNEMVCWDYGGGGSNTCNGDSGGPLLVSQNRAQEVISGVTSGGRNASCLSSDHSFDTSVFRYREWIKGSAGTDLGTKACGSVVPLNQVDEKQNEKRYKPISGQLSDTNPLHVVEVKVKGTQVLRVGVNVAKFLDASAHETAARPQVFIAKESRDKNKALCTSDPAGSAAAFCSVPTPEDDKVYSIVLDRAGNQGRADFQLVVSVF
jgi:hypothetical protein